MLLTHRNSVHLYVLTCAKEFARDGGWKRKKRERKLKGRKRKK